MMAKGCSIEGCDKKHLARGWCGTHYSRWRLHGSPTGGGRKYSTPEEAFHARTEWRGDCLVWTGGKQTNGYGQMVIGDTRILTHRFAWERERGKVPDGMVLDHICRNRACCNVRHLRLATTKQNAENTGLRSDNTSGWRGVFPGPKHGTWRALVRSDGKRYSLGTFKSPEDAGIAALMTRLSVFTHNIDDRKFQLIKEN